jgi:cell division protein FtsB
VVWLFAFIFAAVLSFAVGASLVWLLLIRSQRPSKNALEETPEGDPEEGEPGENNPTSPSSNFVALINAIRNEGRANRREARREDRGKRRREITTIVLIAFTLAAIVAQVREMIKVYEPIREQAVAAQKSAEAASRAAEAAKAQADTLTKQTEAIAKQATAAIDAAKATRESTIAAQRAWVGPQNISFAAELKIGVPIDVTIEYLNTGREPATSFSYEIDTFAVGETSPEFGQHVDPFMRKCFAKSEAPPGQVVYATTGFTHYTLATKIQEELVDNDIISGDKVIVMQGCFIYVTEQAIRHSFFCYFYKNKVTRISALNICPAGHHAD